MGLEVEPAHLLQLRRSKEEAPSSGSSVSTTAGSDCDAWSVCSSLEEGSCGPASPREASSLGIDAPDFECYSLSALTLENQARAARLRLLVAERQRRLR